MNWYFNVLKKYAVFTGRATRREFWMFHLFQLIIAVVLGIVDGILGTGGSGSPVGVLVALYWFATLLPSLAVLVRRLHDTNRSGWWVLFGLIPLVGFIVLLASAIEDSDPSDNRYGPNPKLMAMGFAPGAPAPQQAQPYGYPPPPPPQPYGYQTPPATPSTGPPPAESTPPAPRFCSSCGAQLSAGARFCPSCGRSV